jgi:hypothetical protein
MRKRRNAHRKAGGLVALAGEPRLWTRSSAEEHSPFKRWEKGSNPFESTL